MNSPTFPQSVSLVPDESDPSLVLALLNERVKLGEDFSTNGNDGTPTDVILDRFGAKFNGASSNITVVGNLFGGTDATMGVWVKSSFGVGRHIICGGQDAGTRYDFVLLQEGTQLRAYVEGSVHDTGDDYGIDDNAWHYLVMRTDGTDVKIFVDGIEKYSDPETATLSSSTHFLMGQDISPGYYFSGHMHDCRVNSEAKAAKWISSRYEMAVPA